MSTLAVADIVRSIRDLPSPPIIVMELLRSFEDTDVGTAVLAEKVARDQALAAKTLRLANSSFYGLSRKVTTIQQAITILGFDSVRALVTATSITECFQSSSEDTFDISIFWRHSIGTAVCAKLLAKSLNLNQNYAFICGLLHDIGKLVFVTKFAQQYLEVVRHRAMHDCHSTESERAVLGVDHTFVGRVLAENWKFPLLMQKAIANHHAPMADDTDRLQSIVHVANSIVHALDLVNQDDDLVPPVSPNAWKALNIGAAELMRVFRTTEFEFEEACQILTA